MTAHVEEITAFLANNKVCVDITRRNQMGKYVSTRAYYLDECGKRFRNLSRRVHRLHNTSVVSLRPFLCGLGWVASRITSESI